VKESNYFAAKGAKRTQRLVNLWIAIERFERGVVNLALTEVWLFGLHAIAAPSFHGSGSATATLWGNSGKSYVRFK
jgi:hypothetical protein